MANREEEELVRRWKEEEGREREEGERRQEWDGFGGGREDVAMAVGVEPKKRRRMMIGGAVGGERDVVEVLEGNENMGVTGGRKRKGRG